MRQVLDASGHPSICGDCREMQRYEGNRRTVRIVCGCPQPEIKPRLSAAGRRTKGARTERAERKKMEALGIRSRSQPGSGAFGTRESITGLTGDNVYTIAGKDFRCEVKARAGTSGFAVILGWMRDCHLLTIKQDRQEPFHVLSDETFRHLVSAANRSGE